MQELLQHHEDDDQFLACQGVNIFKQLNDLDFPNQVCFDCFFDLRLLIQVLIDIVKVLFMI